MSKTELTRFLALDCATTNSGFALFHDGKPINYGKFKFEGDSEHERAMTAAAVMYGYLKENPVPVIVIESSFFGVNPSIATNLAMSHGAVIGGAALAGVTSVASVVPIQWQTGIGNHRLTKDEKRAIMNEYPGKTASWYKKASNIIRKERTIKIVKDTYNIDVRDNDVADALGIGLFVSKNPEGVRW
jgi:Holliday junction resolvasome RuvABC endonuclease subunit